MTVAYDGLFYVPLCIRQAAKLLGLQVLPISKKRQHRST